MAKTDNLNDFLKDIADAIREKKGTSDPINAQDFADEIKNGGNSGGGTASTMEYFSAQDAPQLTPYMSVVKAILHSGHVIQISPYVPKLVDIVKQGEILAFGVDFQARNLVALGEQKVEMSMLDGVIQETGLSADQIAAIPRITEEEFYNLEA